MTVKLSIFLTGFGAATSDPLIGVDDGIPRMLVGYSAVPSEAGTFFFTPGTAPLPLFLDGAAVILPGATLAQIRAAVEGYVIEALYANIGRRDATFVWLDDRGLL